MEGFNRLRVFKKTAPNGKITLYIEQRELCITKDGIQHLNGILFVDQSYVKDRKVYGQFVLTFRYGREDEEVMGLRFCNEACLSAQQLWPALEANTPTNLTPLQETLVKRLGAGAVPFSFTISSLAPPSVTLLPARSYAGAPIGTNYDLRIFVGESPEDKPQKRSSIRMGMKLYQLASPDDTSPPYASMSKQLLLSEGQVEVEASLDKPVYEKGEQINVSVSISNHSSRNVRRIKVQVVQYVDVAMFSNGKFKNIVATLDCSEGCPVNSGSSLTKQYGLSPARGTIKNWIALEEFYDRDSCLASSVARPEGQERNVFAIYVNYYVKVKIFTSPIGEACLKVPFKIMRRPTTENIATSTNIPQVVTDGVQITTSQSMYELNRPSQGAPPTAPPRVSRAPMRSNSEDFLARTHHMDISRRTDLPENGLHFGAVHSEARLVGSAC